MVSLITLTKKTLSDHVNKHSAAVKALGDKVAGRDDAQTLIDACEETIIGLITVVSEKITGGIEIE